MGRRTARNSEGTLGGRMITKEDGDQKKVWHTKRHIHIPVSQIKHCQMHPGKSQSNRITRNNPVTPRNTSGKGNINGWWLRRYLED